ncbi:MAG: response regulator transcription factor [Anaerolineales bacterium]|nr:MAG: response regulator transcription factor [Anaerolineales bacterium]
MKALIVDDDRVLADVVAFALRREGFQVIQAYDGLSALERWSDEQPDLIVLDINLPKMDGYSVCQRIRREADTPIIMLTVRNEDSDVVHGLELGADDYITKPFSPRQLMARVHAVLRRTSLPPAPAPHQVGGLLLVPNRREVNLPRGETVSLTPLEGRLLEYLMINAGQVMTADIIIDHVWGPQGGDRDMLRQLIHRLRHKIEPEPAQPTYIVTVSGYGYGLLLNQPNT